MVLILVKIEKEITQEMTQKFQYYSYKIKIREIEKCMGTICIYINIKMKQEYNML